METVYKFCIDEKVRKVGGSYQANGTIKAQFAADDGSPRYVFRFDEPPGLLHIFGEKQLDFIKNKSIEERPIEELRRDYQYMLEDWNKMDIEVREYAREVLSDFEVDGDTFAVPSVQDIVESLVEKIKKASNYEN